METTIKRVGTIFAIVFDRNDLEISESTCANDIEGWDSLQHLNLLAMIEKEFNIRFEIDDIITMETVGDIIWHIEMRMSK